MQLIPEVCWNNKVLGKFHTDVLVLQLRHHILGYKMYTGHRPRYVHPRRGGYVARCGGLLDIRGIAILLLVGVGDFSAITQALKWTGMRVAKECTVRMLWGQVVETHSQRNVYACASVAFLSGKISWSVDYMVCIKQDTILEYEQYATNVLPS